MNKEHLSTYTLIGIMNKCKKNPCVAQLDYFFAGLLRFATDCFVLFTDKENKNLISTGSCKRQHQIDFTFCEDTANTKQSARKSANAT